MLASLMAPSFAAGAITGEKERMSYEMLLATPLRPGAIVLGKLFAALCHLGILMICSLPIVMLCLPLGGVSLYEVFAAYLGMIATVGLFGMISLWASSYFRRTSASLVVSYLMILPLAVGLRAGVEPDGAAGAGAAVGDGYGGSDRMHFAVGADVAKRLPAAAVSARPGERGQRGRRSGDRGPRRGGAVHQAR